MSLCEIFLLALIAPIIILIRNIILVSHRSLQILLSALSWQIIDGIVLIFPSLISFTLLSEFVSEVIIIGIVAIVILFTITNSYNPQSFKTFVNLPLYSGSKKQFLTNFRSSVNTLACITILAVDFSIFPIRFQKSELLGVGLMDIGVGSYIGISALVSRCVTRPAEYVKISFCHRLVSTLGSCSLISLIGVGRMTLLYVFSYHQPVREYGVHWNFFLTIAVVRLVAFAVMSLSPHSILHLMFLWSLPMLLVYQWALNNGLTHYLQYGRFEQCSNCSDLREGFFNSNREGILSTIGFSWIYLASLSIGLFLQYNMSSVYQAVNKLSQLTLIAIILWVATCFSQVYIQPISRCAANLAYCLWTIAMQLSFLAIFLLVDLITAFLLNSKKQQQVLYRNDQEIRKNCENMLNKMLQSSLLEAVNSYQLYYFLMANILTGLVNVVIGDQPVWKSIAFLILAGYQLILIIFVISLKFA